MSLTSQATNVALNSNTGERDGSAQTAYQEFKCVVTIWDLSDPDDESDSTDSTLARQLFSAVGVRPPKASLLQLWRSDWSTPTQANQHQRPCSSTSNGDVLLFCDASDKKSFLAFDMYKGPTDQMETVPVMARVPSSQADETRSIMRRLKRAAEITAALLEGDLGLIDSLDLSQFPRSVADHGLETTQHLHVFRDGELAASSLE